MRSETVQTTTLDIEAAESPYRKRSISIFTVTLLLLVFFESINPPESYIHQFLLHAKQIGVSDIPRYIIPFFTYGQLIGFLPLTLLSELVGKCSHVIALGISLRIGSSLLHLLGPSAWLLPHQIARSLYGIASASKVAIKTHAYANLPHEVYVTITGYMRAVNLVAHVMGASLGFIFYSKKLDWSVAFSVQVASLLIAVTAFLCNIAFCVPRTKLSPRIQNISSFHDLVSSSKQMYENNRALAAITIWAVAMDSIQLCYQTQKSSLIHAVDESARSNGLAVAGCRLASALTAFLIGHFPHLINGFRLEWLYLATVAISLSIFITAYSWNIYMVYCSFLLFSVISDAFQCIATALIALNTPSSLRGWILFGNQFIAIVLASSIQFVLGTVFALEIRWIYFGLASIAFSIPFALMAVSQRNARSEESAGS